jgi:hypothetical protein
MEYRAVVYSSDFVDNFPSFLFVRRTPSILQASQDEKLVRAVQSILSIQRKNAFGIENKTRIRIQFSDELRYPPTVLKSKYSTIFQTRQNCHTRCEILEFVTFLNQSLKNMLVIL